MIEAPQIIVNEVPDQNQVHPPKAMLKIDKKV